MNKWMQACGACVLASSSLAMAELQLVTDKSVYQVAPGSPALVHVYLQQTNGEITAGGGLNGSAAQLQMQTPAPAQPMTLQSITPSSSFDFTTTQLANRTLGVSRNSLSEGVAAVGNRVELGVFQIGLDAGNLGQSTSYRFVAAPRTWTYMANGTGPYDASLVPSAVFSVTAVPEPTLLCGLAGGSLLLLRRQRRLA